MSSSFLTSIFSYFWQQTWQQMFSSLWTLVIFHEQLKNVYHFFINWCCCCCCCRCCCCCCPWVFVGCCFYHFFFNPSVDTLLVLMCGFCFSWTKLLIYHVSSEFVDLATENVYMPCVWNKILHFFWNTVFFFTSSVINKLIVFQLLKADMLHFRWIIVVEI